MNIYLNNKKVNLSPQKMIGKGGEAEIYALNQKEVIKVFKLPSHPDFAHDLATQKAVGDRLKEHQQKLPQFPQGLPANVLTPQQFIRDAQGQIFGYTMPYLTGTHPLYRYGDRHFREQNGIDQPFITTLFQRIHQTLTAIHAASMVVGDFNDLNILVAQDQPYFIDTDSWQFHNFQSRVFTARFVDPLLCDPQGNSLELIQNHNRDSDWYAFAVMLFRSLLYVEPYGGIYADKTMPQGLRPLHRITVFHPKVKYPKPALHWSILADDLLHYFQQCFEGDQRGIFPVKLLQSLQWQTCTQCGQVHSKKSCPHCQVQISFSPTLKTTALKQIFATQGTILATDFTGKIPHYLYWEQGEFKRETGQVIFQGDRRPDLHFWVQGTTTYVGQGNTILCFDGSTLVPEHTLQVDSDPQPGFCGDRHCRYWLTQGKLWRDGTLGAEPIGDILSAQTRFWLEQGLGFGFYQVGHLFNGFIFDGDRHGINDQIQLPPLQGEIIEVDCEIGADIWLFLSVQHRGQLQQHLWVINSQGKLRLQQTFTPSELPTLSGHCAIQTGLLMATDQGITHWSIQQGHLHQTLPYPHLNDHITSGQRIHKTGLSPHDQLWLLDHHHIWQW